ncbi:C-type mannose receptor 2-like [Leguminivora glycinivorella]|uniref:C-type mannose receptor 2-like n=1 Tax=Leguminivora glycinivorella TaxID=1035111 RepID=UPI00200EA5B5|nr:C-type mannose receptor 2-like [Leguminivora glycinivorella]
MLLKVLVFVIGLAIAAASRCEHFYRKDYTYIDQFDAFYKLHWDLSGQTWGSAFLACDDEGATLFYPKTTNEWTVVKDLVALVKHKPNVTEIFVGIHDEFGLGEFMTVDGMSTPSPLPDKDQDLEGQSACVVMEIDTGTYRLEACETDSIKPYVCKKVEEVIPACPTIDRGYNYDKKTKKCYKLNQRKKPWTEAMQTCFMEGGILAVVTNTDEADIVFQRLPEYEEEYFVGFRRLFPNGDFYTVKGQQFDNTFYKRWRNNGNNGNDENESNNDCGTVSKRYDYRDLFTGTRNCLQPAAFVCEMVPKN